MQHVSSPEALGQILAAGSAAMQSGDLQNAEAAFQRVTIASPTHADGFYGLGLVRLREGDPRAAIQALERAIKLNRKFSGAHVFLGIAQYQEGQASEAMENVRAELILNPNNVEALMWAAIIALGSGHPEAAIIPIDRGATLRPDDAQILHYQVRAHSLVAEQALARLSALDPDSVIVHQARAESLASARRPIEAIAEYQAALTKEPKNADLLDGLGEQQQTISRFDDAKSTYEEEIAVDPSSSTALFNLGKMDVEHDKPEEGVMLLRKAVIAHAAPAPTAYYMGYGLAKMGQYDEAMTWLEKTLASQPSSFIEEVAYFQLLRVYQHLGRKKQAQDALAKLSRLKAQESPGNHSTNNAKPLADAPPHP